MSILESSFISGFIEYCVTIDVDWYTVLANPLRRLEHVIRFSRVRPDLTADLYEQHGTLADVSQCIGENKGLITCRIEGALHEYHARA